MNDKELNIKNKWDKSNIFRVEFDKLKKLKVIYTSPILINQFGCQNADMYPYLIGDAYSRYYRMNNYNVLYSLLFNNLAKSSFVEVKKKNNRLDNSLVNEYMEELASIGVCYDKEKSLDLNSNASVLFIQEFFLKLFHLRYIKYEKKSLYTDNNKYYQSFEISDVSNMSIADFDVFTLNVKSVRDKAIEMLYQLKLSDDTLNKALAMFQPYEVYDIVLNTFTNEDLIITMLNPEYIGGLSFIILNPNLMKCESYITLDERENVNNALLNDIISFSGNYAINPLTGRKIPIFISDKFAEKIHLGIPDINMDDYNLCQHEGFEFIGIVEDGYMLNSDFLNGMRVEDAKASILEMFLSEGIARTSYGFAADSIVISSKDEYGCIIPLLIDEGNITPLDKHLPITFSSKFRYIIPESDKIDAIGNIVSASLNKYFIGGLAPLITILYDKNTGITNPFSQDGIKELNEFKDFECFIINEDRIVSDLVMPIIFYLLVEEIMKSEIKFTINNVIVVTEPIDADHKQYLHSNLNLLDFNKIIDCFLADAIRLYYFTHLPNEEFIFNEDDIEYYQNIVYSIKRCFGNEFVSNAYNLEMVLYEFDKKMSEYFLSGDFKACYDEIITIQKKHLQSPSWTKKQAFIFLKWVAIFLPYLGEEVFSEVFKENYSIFEEFFK